MTQEEDGAMLIGIEAGVKGIYLVAAHGDVSNLELVAARELKGSNHFGVDLGRIEDCLGELTREFGPVTQLGMAIAGRLSPDRSQVVRSAGGLTGWSGRELARTMSGLSGAKYMRFGTVAEAHALHEARVDPNLSDHDFVYIRIDRGISVARITWIGGLPFATPTDAGHVAVPGEFISPNKRQCSCGQYNCLERLGSETGIRQRFDTTLRRLTSDQLADVAGHHARGIAAILLAHPVEEVVYGGPSVLQRPELYPLVRGLVREQPLSGNVVGVRQEASVKLVSGTAALALL